MVGFSQTLDTLSTRRHKAKNPAETSEGETSSQGAGACDALVWCVAHCGSILRHCSLPNSSAQPHNPHSLPLQIPHLMPCHTEGAVAVVKLLSHVQISVTPWTAARQASLSFTISWSLLKPMSIELVMPSNHLILCCPLLLLPSVFPSI